MSSEKYPKLDLLKGTQWLTKNNNIVGPFLITSLVTNKNVPIFKCAKTQQLYDIYGVEVQELVHIYKSYKRLKLSTIVSEVSNEFPMKNHQSIGRGLRDSNPNVISKNFDKQLHTNADFINRVKSEGSKIFKKISDTNYEMILGNITELKLSPDYEYLDNICDCEACQVAKASADNGIETNVVRTAKMLYNYLTITMKVPGYNLIYMPNFGKLPVLFHHIIVNYLIKKFEQLTDCTVEEVSTLLEDYDLDGFEKHRELHHNTEQKLFNYGIVSQEYIDDYTIVGNDFSIKILDMVEKELELLYKNTSIIITFDTDWKNLNAYRLARMFDFFKLFQNDTPRFPTDNVMFLVFVFENDESSIHLNIETQPELIQFVTARNKIIENLAKHDVNINTLFLTEKLNNLLNSDLIDCHFKNTKKPTTNTETNLNEFNFKTANFPVLDEGFKFKKISIDPELNPLFTQEMIDKYVKSIGFNKIPHHKGKSYINYRKGIIELIELKITDARVKQKIGVEFSINIFWDKLGINNLIKILYFFEYWFESVIKHLTVKSEPKYMLLKFDFYENSIGIYPTDVSNTYARTAFSNHYYKIVNSLNMPIEPKKALLIRQSVIENDNFFINDNVVDLTFTIEQLKKMWYGWYYANENQYHMLNKNKIKSVQDLIDNTEMKEIIESMGTNIDSAKLFTGKKAYKKTIIFNDKPKTESINLLEITNEWFDKNKFKLENKQVRFWNEYDLGRFINFQQFKQFYESLLKGTEGKLKIAKTKFIHIDYLNEIMCIFVSDIIKANTKFDFESVFYTNHVLISFKPSL